MEEMTRLWEQAFTVMHREMNSMKVELAAEKIVRRRLGRVAAEGRCRHIKVLSDTRVRYGQVMIEIRPLSK